MDISTNSELDSQSTIESLSHINDLVLGAVDKGSYQIIVGSEYMDDNVMSILTNTYGYHITKKINDNGSYVNYIINWFGIPAPTPGPTSTPTSTPTSAPTSTPTVTPTPTSTSTPTPTPTSSSNGQFVYNAQPSIGWNSYGSNYLSFGESQDGTNRTPLAGWYFKDSNNVVRQLLNTPLWFSGGNPSPYRNGNGWMAVANGSFSISASETTITFYETSPV